jgi:phosphonate transport system ATP-binding protein
MPAMLELDGLTRRFGAKLAVDNVSLRIENGAFVGVIGPSGAGKSTLLRLIARLVEPSAGRILFEGVDVTALRGRALRQWRAQAAMIFQQFNLIGRLDVLTNVLIGRIAIVPAWRALLGMWPDRDKAIALTALDRFGLAEIAAQRAELLSGGQQQRVAIARALVQEPDLLLADEPVASLDPHNTRLVMDALRQINQDFGITVLCNLHAVDLAQQYCDRLIGMSAGRIVFDGAPSALTETVTGRLYGAGSGDVAGDAAAPEPPRPPVEIASTPSRTGPGAFAQKTGAVPGLSRCGDALPVTEAAGRAGCRR